MIDSTTPTTEQNQPGLANKRSRFFATLCFALVGLLVLTGALGVWLTSSESGARFALSTLGTLTGFQFKGISGTLNHLLSIQHVEMRNTEMEISADDVELQWQPGALFGHHIHLDFLRINSLELALAGGKGQTVKLPGSLRLPELIKQIAADQLVVHQFRLADLDSSGQRSHVQVFSELKAVVAIDSANYAVQLSGVTPWGNAQLKGELGAAAPFNVQAQINWLGLAIQQHGVAIPRTSVIGTVTGTLSRLQIQAQLDTLGSDSESVQESTRQSIAKSVIPRVKASGQVNVVLTPFATLPLDSVQFDLISINPASFYKDAPNADLQLKADLRLAGNLQTPRLSGHVYAANSRPAPWNSGGIPVTVFDTDLSLSKHELNWKNAKIKLDGKGSASGAGEVIFSDGNVPPASTQIASKFTTLLPELATQIEIRNVNLLRIDSRLKATQLSGKILVKNQNQALNFVMHLEETDSKLNARLHTELSLDRRLKITLKRFELSAKEATLSASGFVDLHDRQAFSLMGDAHNFNPARWIDVPDGRIATHFKVSGQIQQGWQVDAQMSELSGQFAGLDLHGESDFHAQQNRLLAIKKLDIGWGKNRLSASGNWQLGTRVGAAEAHHEALQFTLAVPDLAALIHPFQKILHVELQGSVFIDGVVAGNAARPSGHLEIKADQVAIPKIIYLDHLQGNFALADGEQAKIDGNLTITKIATSAASSKEETNFKVERLELNLTGLRHAHTLVINATLPQEQQVTLRAQGDLQAPASGSEAQWAGKILALNLFGPLDFQLVAPFDLHVSEASAQIGEASWKGKLGRLHLKQLNWMHGQLQTSGQFQEIPVVKVLKLWRSDLPVTGKLTLEASWQLDVGQHVEAQILIQRTGGDLAVQDATNGNMQLVALGLQKVVIKTDISNDAHHSATELVSRQPVNLTLQAQGDQLGLVNVNLLSYLSNAQGSWTIAQGAPVSGQATLQIKDISWASPLLGSGINLHGELNAQAQISGLVGKPTYQATISGKNLQLAFTELGVLLPNGQLEAGIEGNQFKLSSLKFSQTIKRPPRHENLTELNWLNQTGFVESTGTVDLDTGRGSIITTWEKFPFLQTPEGWLVASGQAQLVESEKVWNVTGGLIADAAYFSVPKQAAPRLSSDVVVLKKNAKRSIDKTNGFQSNLDFSISTGKNFIFVGRGIDTRLDGDIRIRSKNGGTILATGSIRTVGGNYEGYGQQLAIDRGILNFQGPIDNPGLNIRAIRRGLPVEAGVEVVGTVGRPEVHLISEPNVPDPDKLSWMVLGRASDQMAGSEATLLMSAAGAIFGGDDGSNIPSTIAHTFGLEDLTFGTTSTSPESQLPTQTVAGTITSTASTDQVFSVGKRIAPDIVFSIERSLTDASNGLKLTWQLTRRFSIIGRAGSDTAIDGQYTFSFD